MRTRTDYKICPLCGASLDVGEACDCQQEEERTERPKMTRNTTRLYKYAPKGKNALKRQISAL